MKLTPEYIKWWNEEEARLWAKLPEPKDGRFRMRAALDDRGHLVFDEPHENKSIQQIGVELLESFNCNAFMAIETNQGSEK